MNRVIPSSLLLVLFFPSLHAIAVDIDIGIGIGVGHGQPSPPPSALPEPQPCDFLNEKQYEAYKVIQRFKRTITCDPLNVTRTWSGTRPCNYRGFFCETPPGLSNMPTIASVDFNGFHLCAPTLSGFVDRLPDLALFHANSNKFASTVPDLSALPFLYELDVSNNVMSGCFPETVLPLVDLQFLDLRFNMFAGAVPAAVFGLRVDVLFLNNNQFEGEIPEDLGRSRAAYLTLANNGFTGPIPASIGDAADSLLQVLFLNNQLSGCLPSEIGRLRKATVFDAGFNQLTGPIPHSFGCLQNVEQLNLAGNHLYGDIPEALCCLNLAGKLLNLSLSQNYFTGLGPFCRTLIHRGILDVRRNCIPGQPEQRSPAECAAFLARCPTCPLQKYMSCRHSASTGDRVRAGGTGSVPLPGSSPAPVHRAYSALLRPLGGGN